MTEQYAAYIHSFVRPSKPVDAATVWRYARVAAEWSILRLRLDRDEAPTPADSQAFLVLTTILRRLTGKLGLQTATDEPPRKLSATTRTAANTPDAILGITDFRGFLPKDRSRFLTEDWRVAVEGWNA